MQNLAGEPEKTACWGDGCWHQPLHSVRPARRGRRRQSRSAQNELHRQKLPLLWEKAAGQVRVPSAAEHSTKSLSPMTNMPDTPHWHLQDYEALLFDCDGTLAAPCRGD
ncbi:MAG: hypothetical protein EBZ13_04880 [Planctomycetia bacterium]|nr:hypothetical protein [Planctomycetia bacterium]